MIIISLGLIIVLLFIKNSLQKRELQLFLKQLEDQMESMENDPLYIQSQNKITKQLASQINRLIQKKQDVKAKQLKQDQYLKEAITSMSHDLRTPLTAILGYLRLLKKEDLTEQQENYIIAAYSRANYLEKLIDNFFSLSELEAKEYPLTLKPLNLTNLLQEVLVNFYDDFQRLLITPQFDIPKKNVSIIADEMATYRVIENIILNALQHHSTQRSDLLKQFHLSLKVKDKQAILSLTNTFDPHTVDETKIFQRFYTGDHSRQTSGGLGLSIVKHLMQQIYGDVEVFTDKDLFTIVCYFKLSTS